MDQENNKNLTETTSNPALTTKTNKVSSAKTINNNIENNNELNQIIQNQISSFIKSNSGSSCSIPPPSNSHTINNNSATPTVDTLKTSSISLDEPTAMKQNIPAGILKHSKAIQQPIVVPPVAPQLNSFIVDGKEIVIIDKEFIQESTKNQNDVTVVKNPQNSNNMELAEALGKDWPEAAGPCAQILNSERSSTSSATNLANFKQDRVKSMNPLSHIMAGKRTFDRKNRGTSVDGGPESCLSSTASAAVPAPGGSSTSTLKKSEC